MVSDSATVVEAKKNKAAVESAVETFLTNNSGVTSIDDVEGIYEMNDRVGILITYTA